jgi:hypothetical protein
MSILALSAFSGQCAIVRHQEQYLSPVSVGGVPQALLVLLMQVPQPGGGIGLLAGHVPLQYFFYDQDEHLLLATSLVFPQDKNLIPLHLRINSY